MFAIDDASDLKPKQIKALAALAAGASDERAAEVSGVSRPTVAKWRRTPIFAAALAEALRLQRDRIQAMLGALAQDAERVVRDAMGATKEDGSTDHATRLRAAEATLGTYVRISQKAAESAAPPAGPLIVLPPGTQRMALALDDGPPAARELPAVGASVTVLPTLPKVTSGVSAVETKRFNVVEQDVPQAQPQAGSAGSAGSTSPHTQRATLPPARQLPAIALTADPDDPDAGA